MIDFCFSTSERRAFIFQTNVVYFYLQPEMDERLQRLEGDKDSLQMQVSILMDQIEAQTDKIADLERTLSDRAYQLQRSEENLQKVHIALAQNLNAIQNPFVLSTHFLRHVIVYLRAGRVFTNDRNCWHVRQLRRANWNCSAKYPDSN